MLNVIFFIEQLQLPLFSFLRTTRVGSRYASTKFIFMRQRVLCIINFFGNYYGILYVQSFSCSFHIEGLLWPSVAVWNLGVLRVQLLNRSWLCFNCAKIKLINCFKVYQHQAQSCWTCIVQQHLSYRAHLCQKGLVLPILAMFTKCG